MNKRNSLKIQSQAYDIVKHSLWKSAAEQSNPKRIKEIEKMLIDLDASLFFTYQMLHDIIQGKDAQFICKIRPDGAVLIGHQHQAVYFSLEWEAIHKLSADIKEYEKQMEKEKGDLVKKYEEQLLQLKQMILSGLINNHDVERYLKALETPPHVTPKWLKDHVFTYEELEDMAGRKIARKWEKNNQIKGPKVLSNP